MDDRMAADRRTYAISVLVGALVLISTYLSGSASGWSGLRVFILVCGALLTVASAVGFWRSSRGR